MTCQLTSNLTDLFDQLLLSLIRLDLVRNYSPLSFSLGVQFVTNNIARHRPLSQLDQPSCYMIGYVCLVTIVLRCHV